MTPADKKLRVLHTEASVGWGGQEIRILTEAQYFQAKGHEVLIAANAGSTERCPACWLFATC
jgi:hypothetical protein